MPVRGSNGDGGESDYREEAEGEWTQERKDELAARAAGMLRSLPADLAFDECDGDQAAFNALRFR